jgi:hypothetical protein
MKRPFILPLVLVAALAVACGGTGSGGGTGSPGSPPSAAPNAGASVPPGASNARIAAIAAVISRTSNPDDAFVTFTDTSDAVPNGPERSVQMTCEGGRGCHFEALCDKPPLTCDRVGARLQALGLRHDPQNADVYFVDRNGSAADFAILTETVYLTVFGASPGYRLSWRSQRQTTQLPVQA